MILCDAQTAVVLDAHPLWLGAVEKVLARIGIRVTGRASSLAHTLTLVAEARPELLVADLPNGNAPTFLAKARQLAPDLRTIVLSADRDTHHIDAALEAGAAAYVIKTTQHPYDLAAAIRQTFNHSIYLPARQPAAPAVSPLMSAKKAGLTRREREILRLVAEGYSNAEVARMLWVTEQTVKFHLSNIYRKLDVCNRTKASRWAQLNGLISEVSPQRESSIA